MQLAKSKFLRLICSGAAALAFVVGADLASHQDRAAADLIVPRKRPAVAPVKPGTPSSSEDGKVKKIDPKTQQIPFAGLAAKSDDEIAKALEGKTVQELVEASQKLNNENMFADANAILKAILKPETDEQNYIYALDAFSRSALGAADSAGEFYAEVEQVFEKALQDKPDSWRVKAAIARDLDFLPPNGETIDGTFVYSRRWGPNMKTTQERVRVRKLQLYFAALPAVREEGKALLDQYAQLAGDANAEDNLSWNLTELRNEIKSFYTQFIYMFPSDPSNYWRLQTLTDISVLPDYEPIQDRYRQNRNSGAPVDAEGNPIFYTAPDSFETAKNDGERKQALRAELLDYDRSRTTKIEILSQRASEGRDLFGVHTLQSYRYFFNDQTDKEQEEAQAGIWALNTLKDSETIAKLANGVKRFELPPEYDYLNLWLEVLELEKAENAFTALRIAEEYKNRRQFEKAADVLRASISVDKSENVKTTKEALSQIVDPRVQIDASSKISGLNANLAIRYRNAKGAKVVVQRLNVDAALEKIRSKKFWQEFDYGNLALAVNTALFEAFDKDDSVKSAAKRILERVASGRSIVGEEIAKFSVDFDPDPNHYDKLAPVELPVHEPGAFLVQITADDGNTDAAVVWLRDLAVAIKPFEGGQRFFVLDAVSGRPQPDRKVEFFAVTRNFNRGKTVVKTDEFTKTTDQNGSILLENDKIVEHGSTEYLALVPSKDPKKPTQFAFMDFQNLWRIYTNYDLYQQRRAFFVSDRPIYRPGQNAKFKFIVGNAQYDAPETNSFAGQVVHYRISSPTGEEVKRGSATLDEYGTFEDSFDIPNDAKLGVYNVMLGQGLDANGNIRDYLGDGTFRLEEYRKPEFQVNVDAPKDPVALGDSFKATVNAKYYFGAPVANATVSYKVTRTNYQAKYYPPRYWDWFYGCGYWQFTYDCEWYPGWSYWGCKRLPPFYVSYGQGMPEVVAEGEAEIGEDGKFEIAVDTSLAKTIFPNDDQQYEIQAEVTDRSRRTIVGTGKVYAARQPFQTYVWFDRGYLRAGESVTAGFQARRIDGKPVEGTAVVKLFKIKYEATDDRSIKPIETEVFSQELKTNEEGKGSVKLVAAEPGQYRLSCVVTTDSGIAEEGGQLIVARGAKENTSVRGDFRFNSLEIVPDKPEYSVGDVAHIQIASNNPNAYVLFAERPVGSVTMGEPKFVKLENGLAYVDVKIEQADQPNIFVQATTVFDGKLYAEQKELAVPPEKRVLDVAVQPDQERVKPGAKAKIKLRLTDVNGEPVVGQTVVTVYDKSLEYVSGGSNIGDIREFFWKWRRYANLQSMVNLDQETLTNVANLIYKEEVSSRLLPLGVFGDQIEDVDNFNGMVGGMGGMGRAMGAKNAMARGVLRKRREAPAMAFSAAARRDGMGDADEVDDVVMEEAADMEEAPAPMMEMAPMATNASMAKGAGGMTSDAPAEAQSTDKETFVEAVVRKNLSDLAYWAADLKPSDNGEIEIEVDMPENLTTWKIGAWTVGSGLRVGSGESEIVTSKDVIIRMQKPRFLTQKDEVVFSANVHNYLDSEKKVRVSLEFPTEDPENSTAKLTFLEGCEPTQDVVVPANAEARVDWTVKADGPGVATLLMKALTDEESDAIQETIAVKEHGIDKQIPISGVVPPADKEAEDQDSQKTRESSFTLVVPEERREETTKLAIRFSPTLAGAIFDALPYLAEYPYGCTEQTLNRFLPLVLTQKALQSSGVDLAALKDKKANLNAQEIGDAQERAKQWRKRRPLNDPVFDIDEVRKMTDFGIDRLTQMQNGDGGWGWFSGAREYSTPRLTALVARGLKQAQNCDYAVDSNALVNAQLWLERYEREQALKIVRGKVWTDEQKRESGAWDKWKSRADSADAAVYYALSELGAQPSSFDEAFVDYEKAELKTNSPADVHSVMKELIWEARTEIDLYPLAIYAIALTNEPNATDDAKLRIENILRLLSQYRKVDDENQTVWLDLGGYNGWRYWSWYGGEYETQAYYLRLLQRVDRQTLDKLGLADDASRLVKYLLNNRKNATYWNSTRDTALCVEAFAEYLQKTNELAPNETVEIYVDGELKKTVEYTPDNLFETDGTLELAASEIASGEHKIALRVIGDGPLYYNAYLEYFTLEDPIEKAGLELKTERRYYKLVENKEAATVVEGGHGQAVSQRVEKYDRVPLNSGDAVVSGDLIEVELIVDSKNEYESILLEDAKAAGFEPVEQRSGYDGNALNAYVEYRDDRVCFFASAIPQGRSTVTYRLRAETPGKFSALPTKIWAMYAPELKGNADEFKAKIDDR